jgi:hypothetical protein
MQSVLSQCLLYGCDLTECQGGKRRINTTPPQHETRDTQQHARRNLINNTAIATTGLGGLLRKATPPW